ncbi:tRNA dimethylallyltransferase protein [Salinisphaera shabanensis E1L3A]|uniref:tRNA dimethylallyltransferase protein n=1 Tax=Salinisphaera shabanensis E1L3A TaxID=1033802 RepID=A0ACB4V5P9_9GAMM|nr:tRNA (adenosine(37)-N6)-dimethylallyltransferase MiaA [Salinisphaera shabanensis]ERJ18986.1 tRNA dimethylallyltransferase protein [Salinisphaera shabanensis E1L3A]
MATQQPGVVFLLGPTASGKTGLAVDLVERLNAEIVSVDSAMVYRGMDIGTAKPDAETLARAPHALIDIRDPAEPYSAADFRADALAEVERIHAAGRLPLLTGGTSLYFRALEHGLSEMPSRNDALRARLTAEAEREGWHALHQRLQGIDPETAQRIHRNDAQRIQRALEIHELTGIAPSVLHARDNVRRNAAVLPWSICKIAVSPRRRETLHERIAQRFESMLAQGLYAEVEKLHARPDLSLELPSMRAVGYRQLWQVMDGEMTLEHGIERAVFASRQLAKRQLTWLRSLDDVTWLGSEEKNISNQALSHIRAAGLAADPVI